jgi:hypothetical protein
MTASTPPTPERDLGAERLVVLGYITAVAIPLAGLVLGIVVATRLGKTHPKHGARIIAISIVATIAWVVILTSNVINTTNPDM